MIGVLVVWWWWEGHGIGKPYLSTNGGRKRVDVKVVFVHLDSFLWAVYSK